MSLREKKVIRLLSDATAVGVGEVFTVFEGGRAIQATITGPGSVSATVEFYGSNVNDLNMGILLATSALSGTNTDTAGGVLEAEYNFMWAKVAAINAPTSKVTATVSV